MKRLIVDGEPTVLQLWDTAGQERLVILCTYVISLVLFLKGICFFSSKWGKKKPLNIVWSYSKSVWPYVNVYKQM